MGIRKWRLEAAQHNAEAGEHHRGRANKARQLNLPKYIAMPSIMWFLFDRAKIIEGTEEEKDNG